MTRSDGWDSASSEVLVAGSVPEAIDAAAAAIDDEVFVVGGAQVYADALPLADRLVLTHVDAEPEGDTRFPESTGASGASSAARRVTAPHTPRTRARTSAETRARAGSLSRMAGSGEVLTSEQMEALQAELAELEGPRRAAAIEAIATARAFGDLSENFEYHAAKNDQGLLEARITKLRARISDADGRRPRHGRPRRPGLDRRDRRRARRRDGGDDLVDRRRVDRLAARCRADGQGRRGRRLGRRAAGRLAGDRPLIRRA